MIRRIGSFLRDTRGAFAMQFALIVTPLIGATGLAIDGGRVFLARFELSSALDAAALAVGSTIDPAVDLDALAQLYVDRNFKTASTGPVAVTLIPAGDTITVTGTVDIETFFMPLFGISSVNVSAESEVQRGGADVEVALVLDTTGSMAGSRIEALQAAATSLINTVVADVQEPYYSKVAIVPYANTVYAGANANTLRGAAPLSKTITAAQWTTSNSGINNITKASQAVVTTSGNHGLSNGDYVYITGLKKQDELDDRRYLVSDKTTTAFKIKDPSTNAYVNSSSYGNYSSTSNDYVYKCLVSSCNVRITANGHGFSNNNYVTLTNIGGMTELNYGNNDWWQITNKTTNTFELVDSVNVDTSNYTSGGKVWCNTVGCQYYRYTSSNGTVRVSELSNCVTERVGSEEYSDASYSTALVGRYYPVSVNNAGCYSDNSIVPLTATKSTLTTAITNLTTSGYTSGHIGLAWGWYAVSPNWSALWPAAENTPAPYTNEDLVKVVVMMTDGEFNMAHCNGVPSANHSSVGSSYRINCNATNGGPFSQAEDLCDAMKADGADIVIYTVGFGLDEDSDEADFMEYCASQPSYAYLAATDEELQQAFDSIATSITLLRLSR